MSPFLGEMGSIFLQSSSSMFLSTKVTHHVDSVFSHKFYSLHMVVVGAVYVRFQFLLV